MGFSILIFITTVFLAALSAYVPHYTTVYSSSVTAEYVLRLLDKWYRVQGGFDNFISLLNGFQPGAIGLIVALWGNEERVIRA